VVQGDQPEVLAASNMSALIRSYLGCSLVDHVILCYGLHGPRKRIFENVLASLGDLEFRLLTITLTCSEEENIRRMAADGREPERIQGSLRTRPIYDQVENSVIDTTHMTVEATVERILDVLKAR
jgi:hypothetical protein